MFAGKGELVSIGRVTYKTRNTRLAKELWKVNADGDTWENVYFITGIRPLDLPYSEFNKAAGYKPANIIRGFTVLPEEKGTRILSVLDLSVAPSASDFETAERKLDELTVLDAKREVLLRIEQAFLRNSLFGTRHESRCGICGRLFPVSLLVAAHVKKRAHCSSAEKRDFQANAMPMCKFGCDDLFEKGYVGVVDGIVTAGEGKSTTPIVSEYLSSLQGRRCEYWNDRSRNYFAWHSTFWGIECRRAMGR